MLPLSTGYRKAAERCFDFQGRYNKENYIRNQRVYEKLYEQQETIEDNECSDFSSNIDSVSLKIGLQFLYASMGKDVYSNILELMPHIQNDIATIVAVSI